MLDFEDGLFNSCSELLKLVFKCSDFGSYSVFGNFGYTCINSSAPTNIIWMKRLMQKLLICRYTGTHALRSVYKEHLRHLQEPLKDFTIYTSMLNTWKLYHWRAGLCLFHRAISCVMAGLRALSIPYDKE